MIVNLILGAGVGHAPALERYLKDALNTELIEVMLPVNVISVKLENIFAPDVYP